MKAVHAVLLFVALAGAATCQLVRKNIFVNRPLSWTQAREYCKTYYEDLSTINTPWEYEKFKNDVADYLSAECWVGLSKSSFNLIYTEWSDGSALGFPVWKFGEPNNLRSYHCVTINNMELADYDCKQPLKFFCYKWVPQMVLVEMMMNWEEALQYCRTYYTDLVSVTSDKDLSVAISTSMTSQTRSVWTGLHFMDGSWFWVNQNHLENLTLLPSCPIRPFHCGALKAGDDGWENRDCNEELNFLCNY
ncbi:C-type mannose receptor 2-like [Pangasianodon hypophthalmus]|uniref:C-type mannose receptor 2-like n=1 Tax=Pangasianodon hypophthalmus TaxID=310915 RepID=UPI000EFF945C|nr:C-type mannose receptor 2-like [Pangasianodon hypophthalmus]